METKIPNGVPSHAELMHLQLQAMLREHDIPKSEIEYIGTRCYTTKYTAHPEYHGSPMHFYIIAGEHKVPVCDIESINRVDN